MGAEEKAEKQAAKEERKNERACKAELKALAQDKDEKLKKPQTAYWLWLGDNRSKIVEMIGSGRGAVVGKKGGEMWKALSDAARAPFEKKAKEQKEAYDKYIASEEGAAALKAFKEAQQATKDQFKPKEVVAETEVVQEDVIDKKRKAKEASEDEPTATKKARGRPPKIQSAKLGA